MGSRFSPAYGDSAYCLCRRGNRKILLPGSGVKVESSENLSRATRLRACSIASKVTARFSFRARPQSEPHDSPAGVRVAYPLAAIPNHLANVDGVVENPEGPPGGPSDRGGSGARGRPGLHYLDHLGTRSRCILLLRI
jgi:hypothetical protein